MVALARVRANARRRFRKETPMRRIGRDLAELDESGPSLAAVSKILSPELVRETLAELGKNEKRLRKLPAVVVTWLVVAMGLFRGLSINNVLRRIADGLPGLSWGVAEVPCSTAISHARDRLGWEVVKALFQRVAEVLSRKHADEGLWRGLLLNVLDGTCFVVPDSPGNDAAFGRPGTSRGDAKSAFPMMRAVLVVGAWTHLVHHAAFGAYRVGEITLAHELVPMLDAGSLLLMDALYYSFAWLAALIGRRVHFLVRAKVGERTLPFKRIRGKGSKTDYPARLTIPPALKKRQPSLPDTLSVRVITFSARRRSGELRTITLVTDLLDEAKYPADEIAALYLDRWEGELVNRELKTHQVATQVTFRSQTPDRIRQEAWGLLLAYNCVRGLMAEAAALNGVQPRRLSFVDCLARIRAAIASLPGRDPADDLERLLTDLATCVLPNRRVGRNCPRAVKVKVGKFPRKRPGSKVVACSRDGS
jgi:hypothetical protein